METKQRKRRNDVYFGLRWKKKGGRNKYNNNNEKYHSNYLADIFSSDVKNCGTAISFIRSFISLLFYSQLLHFFSNGEARFTLLLSHALQHSFLRCYSSHKSKKITNSRKAQCFLSFLCPFLFSRAGGMTSQKAGNGGGACIERPNERTAKQNKTNATSILHRPRKKKTNFEIYFNLAE